MSCRITGDWSDGGRWGGKTVFGGFSNDKAKRSVSTDIVLSGTSVVTGRTCEVVVSGHSRTTQPRRLSLSLRLLGTLSGVSYTRPGNATESRTEERSSLGVRRNKLRGTQWTRNVRFLGVTPLVYPRGPFPPSSCGHSYDAVAPFPTRRLP